MKKIYFAFLSVLVLAGACDIIESPFIKESNVIEPDVVFPPLDTPSVYRVILFEEYTGHTCTNCPAGDAVIKVLSAKFKDTLAIVSIHAGDFAIPGAPPYNADYTTSTGNYLYDFFGISSNPRAVINRTKVSGNWDVGRTGWESAILNIDRSVISAGIQIINQFDASANKLRTHTKTTMLRDYNDPVKLSVFLIEDYLFSPQDSSGVIVENYEHSHVLRLGVNGDTGVNLTTAPTTRGAFFTNSYEVNFSGKPWRKENCKIVSVVFNANTMEVLQVEAAEIP